MNKMTLRIAGIAVAVVAVMMLVCVSQPVYADALPFDAVNYDGFQFRVFEGGSVVLTGYTGTDKVVKLPTHINYKGTIYPVTEIDSAEWQTTDKFVGCEPPYMNPGPFAGNTTIEKIIIPAANNKTGVEAFPGYSYIGSGAFSNCPNLQEVIIGNSTTGCQISKNTFGGCESLKTYVIGLLEEASAPAVAQYMMSGIGTTYLDEDGKGSVYEGVTVYGADKNGEAANAIYAYVFQMNMTAPAMDPPGNTMTFNPLNGKDSEADYVLIVPSGNYVEPAKSAAPGQDIEAVEKYVENYASEKDPKGSKFGLLQAKVSKVGKNYLKVSWKKISGCKYIVYGNKCGKKNKFKKIKTVSTTSFTQKKLKKGTYYKYLIVAVKNGKTVSTSKNVHATTTGGKYGNNNKVTTKAKKNKVTLKKGKSFKLGAKAKTASKKIKVNIHRSVAYESSNTKIATVSSKGVIKAKKKGKCYVYAYAQNGVMAKVAVTVK